MRAMGGGALLLKPSPMQGAFTVRDQMTREKAQGISELLIRACDYVQVCTFMQPGVEEDVALDDWRETYQSGLNLADAHLLLLDKPVLERDRAWMRLEGIEAFPVIMHRSPRYHNRSFPWRKVLDQYRGKLGMVGSEEEHAEFCRVYGYVPYVPTPSLRMLGEVIAGCKLFVGNQSTPYAIAEALKKPAVLEVCYWEPNCIFQRADVCHGWTSRLNLPPI
jgi:hypothetical protein